MEIRTRLTILFMAIVALIMVLASGAIYYFSANHRHEDFYDRLKTKGINTARLLVDVEEVDATTLRRIEGENRVSLHNERIVIFDYQNNELFSTDEDGLLEIRQEHLDDVRLYQEVWWTQDQLEVLGILFADRYDRFVVIIGATDIYGFRKLSNLRNILLIVIGISMVLLFVAGRIFAGRALAPINRVVRQVDNISIHNLDMRVDVGNGQDEVARLAKTFNRMLERLEGAFRLQKNFIANASHELRTPLTAINGQLEVALMKQRSGETYREILESTMDDMRQLNRVANRLLELAQASSEVSELGFQSVRIDDILWQARSELLKRNPEYHVNIAFAPELTDPEHLTVLGNDQLLKTAVLNLMENGCKYSYDKTVTVTAGISETSLRLKFQDKGIGIPPEDIANIFEPFYRSSNAIGIRGHGLGLSIVDRVIRVHGGQVTVASEPGTHTTFTMALPLLDISPDK